MSRKERVGENQASAEKFPLSRLLFERIHADKARATIEKAVEAIANAMEPEYKNGLTIGRINRSFGRSLKKGLRNPICKRPTLSRNEQSISDQNGFKKKASKIDDSVQAR